MALIASMSTRGKITLGACVVGFLLAAFLLVKMASAPSYTIVQTGIDPSQATKITTAMDQAGVKWELQNGGTTLAVDKAKRTQARIALAGGGLLTARQPGFELLDKQKLGASNQQQSVAYQRGLEGEIANTISQIQGAQGAQVRLTLPKDDLFAADQRAATAAVLLGGSATALDPGAVRGIASLVASSVPGLKPASVTITDNTGQMLWPAGDGSGAASPGGLVAKPAAESRYDAQLGASLDALLATTLGPGKARVQVHSDLNVNKASQEELQYAKTGVPLTQTRESETLRGTGAGTGGAAGAANNIPAYGGAAGAAGGNSNYRSAKNTTQYGVDKKVTRTEVAPGAVNRLDVAVMVDQNAKLTPPQLAALKSTLSSAAGLQTARGDTLQVTSIPFAGTPAATGTPGALPIPPAIARLLKVLGIALGALLFLFLVVRHLRRREREELMDQPSWLRELESAAEAVEAPIIEIPTVPQAELPTIATADPRRQALDHIVTNEPDRIAAHLRSWITEDNR